MDFSLVSGIAASITTAKQLGQAALSVRDFNQVANTIAELNTQLLKAQDGLFTHNAQLLELQDQHFKTSQELRELKEAIRERARYSLFELARGNFVYRVNIAPEGGNVSDPLTSQPMHYLCQPCLDKGVKAVLGREHSQDFGVSQRCPVCRREIYLTT